MRTLIWMVIRFKARHSHKFGCGIIEKLEKQVKNKMK